MIKIHKLTKVYQKDQENELKALKEVSLTINKGELVAIIGKSGSGKSTLMHIMACIDTFEEGEYYLDGCLVNDLSEVQLARIRNEKIGIVIQDFALVNEFSAVDNVLLPLDFAHGKVKNKKERALKALKDVGILRLSNQIVGTMSGGQKQRVAIARAIVNCPRVILADEPTGALDIASTEEIMKLLKKLNTEGHTVIIVTHDMQIAEQCTRIIEIKDGELD